MLDELTGTGSPLWDRAPSMALVMFSPVPSGVNSIVAIRERIRDCLFTSNDFGVPYVQPKLRHVAEQFHCYALPYIYIGFGISDIQGRPSSWANPFRCFLSLCKIP